MSQDKQPDENTQPEDVRQDGQAAEAADRAAEQTAEQEAAAAQEVDGEQADGDALSQAEQILREAGADADGAEAAPAGSDREAELEEDLRRVQAEYVNYKRRVDRDRDVAKDQGVLKAVASLLPVLDDLDAARAAGELADGPMAAIATKLDTVLNGLGLERHDQESLAGTEFDPAVHEAVLRQPNDEVPAEHIVQVFRNGYVRNGRVLRAAQVMVSAGAE